MILSGAMMFEYLGWLEVTDLIVEGVRRAIQRKRVTYDLARQLEGAQEVKCSEFAQSIVNEIRQI
jgi:isocitrate dehydrogenase